MTRIGLKWKKPATGPVYLEEAAQLLGTTYEALRTRVHRMATGEVEETLPPAKQETDGRRRWYFERDGFMAFVKAKQQLDKIVKGSK